MSRRSSRSSRWSKSSDRVGSPSEELNRHDTSTRDRKRRPQPPFARYKRRFTIIYLPFAPVYHLFSGARFYHCSAHLSAAAHLTPPSLTSADAKCAHLSSHSLSAACSGPMFTSPIPIAPQRIALGAQIRSATCSSFRREPVDGLSRGRSREFRPRTAPQPRELPQAGAPVKTRVELLYYQCVLVSSQCKVGDVRLDTLHPPAPGEKRWDRNPPCLTENHTNVAQAKSSRSNGRSTNRGFGNSILMARLHSLQVGN